MKLVPRNVRRILQQQPYSGESQTESLRVFRDTRAWVLLGEPGAGKSEALKVEASEIGGQYCSISEFINDDDDAGLQSKTLFLDGLDEVRASGVGDSILARVRRRLKRLGNPPFRVACRAADWYGSSDRDDLRNASPDGEIEILLLEPLGREDILTILHDNYGMDEPRAQTFVAAAEHRGIEDLLNNPQALGMLADAIVGDQWPATRDDTYRLACEKISKEPNKRKRNSSRSRPSTAEEVLDAAGQLSAVLLLSDKTGIALDSERADKWFPDLSDCSPPKMEEASQAVGSKLFRLENEEHMVPSHRSIAEYLAARWLARRVDTEGLPLERVLNLLVGRDGRAVAGLRGLYGWLALHCRAARSHLIDADPLTVIIYGDPRPMTVTDKRRILNGLHREAGRFAGFRWDAQAAHLFGALADVELNKDFQAILQSPERDEATQEFVYCVLDILAYGDVLPELAPMTLAVVRDDTRSSGVRTSGLVAWLRLATASEAQLALLDEITDGRVTDFDDELAGTLLHHLYPAHIAPEALLRYLHKPKDSHVFGAYARFWGYDLPQFAPDAHLQTLLDGLVGRNEVRSYDPDEDRLNGMADKLLARGVVTHGNTISDNRLFAWLGIGVDEYGHVQRGEKERAAIVGWLEGHPERYKGLLTLCFSQCDGHQHPRYCVGVHADRLHGATIPDDLGLWHLDQVPLTSNDELAKLHLFEAVNSLISSRGASSLSIDQIISWGETHPERRDWLDPLLTCDVPDGRAKQAANKRTRMEKRADSRRERTKVITPLISKIKAGIAPPRVMQEMARVWMKRYVDITGETPAARFESYCENGLEVFEAAKTGFPRCISRPDLPTVDEIIASNINNKEHFIRLPCLLGMDLLWQGNSRIIEGLPDETLRRMIAFHLTYGDGKTSAWFSHLVRHCPESVAGVLINYVSTTLRSGKDFVYGIYAVQHDAQYGAVAATAAPRLLEAFPVRARSGQLNHLENLLKATLRYAPKELEPLVRKKIAMKGMDVAQKVYWHGAAMLLDRKSHEAALWRYIGKSTARANYLSNFLSERFGAIKSDYELSARSTGKLVELLAPHAETEWASGVRDVTDAVQRGDQVRALIANLGAMATSEAEKEMDRLLGMHSLSKLKRHLQSAKYQLRQRQRESEFRFLSPQEVAQVLANKSPASASDLVALVLDHLDAVAVEIRRGNDDGFRPFWTETRENGPKKENSCRDALFSRLRSRLEPLGIDCQPEGDYVNDKRADLRLSYHTQFSLPVEIKRDSNRLLWTALRKQLIEQYAHDGYGIYLVLWFGGTGMPAATDGKKKPRSARELQERLEAQLDPIERQRIFVRVFDVSWPD